MDLHTYTRELLDKYLLPELKEIAQGLGITPEGNKTRRETWVAALVGKPFPIFQSTASEEPVEKSLDVDRAQESIENSPGVDRDRSREPLIETVAGSTKNSPGVEVDLGRKPLIETVENSPRVDRAQEQIENSDLQSALAEIARLRVQNQELLELVRSQSEIIRRAKDISPVEKPSLCRVFKLA